MTLNEKLTLSLSTAAILISVATFVYTVVQDQQEKAEVVSISVTQREGDYASEILRGLGDEWPMIVAVEWNGLIANNGSTPVSIVDYDLTRSPKRSALIMHSRMDLGLYTTDGRELELPFLLEPGHATPFRLRTGILADSIVSRTLSEEYKVGDHPPFRELWRNLARDSLDVWGNRVGFTEYSDSAYIFRGPDPAEQKADPFILMLRTARGREIIASFAPYEQKR
jgi:hypothetical protein